MTSTRRRVLQGGGSAALLTLLSTTPLLAGARLAERAAKAQRPYLAGALQAAEWIHRARIETSHGIAWPDDPAQAKFDPDSLSAQTLYSHSPGVVLFLLELHRATGEQSFLQEAQRGADHLAAQFAAQEAAGGAGLYEGMAGIAYAIEMVHQADGQRRHRAAAAGYIEAIRRHAHSSSGAAVWDDFNDIVSGSAGTGLMLLWWARAARDPSALTLASEAGRGLLARAERTADGGLQWRRGTNETTLMPNFSHGTAGISYFLARLHAATSERDFLTAAQAGALHLEAIADTHDDTCSIYHHTEADGSPSQLRYWTWCHGPVGTCRLFHELGVSTRDPDRVLWVHRCARAVLESGIPEQRLPGFWNNVSQCCGVASLMQGFLDLHQAYGNPAYLQFAERAASNLMQRGTLDEHGLRWVQAENRTQPDNLVAQTGFMQGAAGMGTALLHLDGRRHRRAPVVILPDSPFV